MIENIDIGGPTMIRAAAKNHTFSVPVVSPESYDAVLEELRDSDRRLSLKTRESLASEAFAYTARYDTAIARWFQETRGGLPAADGARIRAAARAALRREPASARRLLHADRHPQRTCSRRSRSCGGKDLSFNNLLDLDSARQLLSEFLVPACVIIKHNNPCGVAVGANGVEAYSGVRLRPDVGVRRRDR